MPVLRLSFISALVAALALPLAAGAQSAPPVPPPPAPPATSGSPQRHGHHHSLWHDLKHLGLTSAQQQQAKALHDQVKAANANADRATKAANWRKMRAQLIGILTPAQRSQLQAIRRARGAASRGAAPNSAPQ